MALTGGCRLLIFDNADDPAVLASVGATSPGDYPTTVSRCRSDYDLSLGASRAFAEKLPAVPCPSP
jgi:hypothetical protein